MSMTAEGQTRDLAMTGMEPVRQLSVAERQLIEQRVTNEAKSTGTAYLLWFFLGGFGAHRFYLNRAGSALGLIALWVLGWGFMLSGNPLGILMIAAAGLWLLIDLFKIPGMIQGHKEKVRLRLSSEAMWGRS